MATRHAREHLEAKLVNLVVPRNIDPAYAVLIRQEQRLSAGGFRYGSNPFSVHGPLQVAGYAEAELRVFGRREADLEQQVQLRLNRKELMLQRAANGAQYNYLLDEAVLYRLVGNPAIMAAQLRHLVELAGVNGIFLRVYPFSSGIFEGGDTNFSIVKTAGQSGIVHFEGGPADRVVNEARFVQRYLQLYRAARVRALSPDDSLALIVKRAVAWDAAGPVVS